MTRRPPKKSNYMQRADQAFSKYIRLRDQTCQAAGWDDRECKGNLQCCHLFGRGELAIRTDQENSIAMCASHHVYYTHNPAQWHDLIERMYPGRWEVLRRRVRNHMASKQKVDWKHEAEYWKGMVESVS